MELSERELKVLDVLLSGKRRAREISEKTGIPKQSLYRILRKLEEKGLISKENGEYGLTVLGRRIFDLKQGEIRVHDVKVVLQALEVNLFVAREKGKDVNVKNWNCYYLDLSKYGVPAKAQVNVAEKVTIVLHLPEFQANDVHSAFLTIQNMVAKCRRALELEGLITEEEWLDYSFKVKYHEFAWELPPNDPSEPIEVDLGYKALNPKGERLNYNAKAWIDESLGYKELETNDSLYAHKRVMEPIWTEETLMRVREIHNILQGFNRDFNQTLKLFITAMNQFNQTFNSWNGMITSFTESQKALSQNIMEHIQLVSSVTGMTKEISESVKWLTEAYKSQKSINDRLIVMNIVLMIGLIGLIVLMLVIIWKGA